MPCPGGLSATAPPRTRHAVSLRVSERVSRATLEEEHRSGGGAVVEGGDEDRDPTAAAMRWSRAAREIGLAHAEDRPAGCRTDGSTGRSAAPAPRRRPAAGRARAAVAQLAQVVASGGGTSPPVRRPAAAREPSRQRRPHEDALQHHATDHDVGAARPQRQSLDGGARQPDPADAGSRPWNRPLASASASRSVSTPTQSASGDVGEQLLAGAAAGVDDARHLADVAANAAAVCAAVGSATKASQARRRSSSAAGVCVQSSAIGAPATVVRRPSERRCDARPRGGPSRSLGCPASSADCSASCGHLLVHRQQSPAVVGDFEARAPASPCSCLQRGAQVRSAITRRSAAASSSGSPGGTSSPDSPSVTASSVAPTGVVTTAQPCAIASSRATERPSLCEGKHEHVGARQQVVYRRPPTPSRRSRRGRRCRASAARCANGRASPSPATRSRQDSGATSGWASASSRSRRPLRVPSAPRNSQLARRRARAGHHVGRSDRGFGHHAHHAPDRCPPCR